jgi:RNA recognition motif-containing protein
MCATLNGNEITGSLLYLDRRPVYGIAVIFFNPGRAGESSIKMDVRIYVGNLAKSTTQDEINTLFATAGTVSSVDLVMDKGSGLSKGFAFVAMPDQAEADKAISMFNDYSLADNTLKVNIAKPKVG